MEHEKPKDLSDERRKPLDGFVLAEYSAVREEIKWIIGQVDTLENTALIFTGAAWAWIATQKWRPLYLLLPLVLSILFFVKRRSLSNSLKEVAAYVMTIEEYFGLPQKNITGWEHHLDKNKPRHFRWWRRAFWFLLIAVNFGMALFTWYYSD